MQSYSGELGSVNVPQVGEQASGVPFSVPGRQHPEEESCTVATNPTVDGLDSYRSCSSIKTGSVIYLCFAPHRVNHCLL